MRRDVSRARATLDKRFTAIKQMPYARPHKGWLAAIRAALGMTAEQLARRMGVSAPAVLKLEKREAEKTIQLNTLEKAAAAVGCELVYMLVPQTSLEDFIEQEAREQACRYLQHVNQTMLLECQSLLEADAVEQFEALVADLKDSPKRLWS